MAPGIPLIKWLTTGENNPAKPPAKGPAKSHTKITGKCMGENTLPGTVPEPEIAPIKWNTWGKATATTMANAAAII